MIEDAGSSSSTRADSCGPRANFSARMQGSVPACWTVCHDSRALVSMDGAGDRQGFGVIEDVLRQPVEGPAGTCAGRPRAFAGSGSRTGGSITSGATYDLPKPGIAEAGGCAMCRTSRSRAAIRDTPRSRTRRSGHAVSPSCGRARIARGAATWAISEADRRWHLAHPMFVPRRKVAPSTRRLVARPL
jgi:hypothetical protein